MHATIWGHTWFRTIVSTTSKKEGASEDRGRERERAINLYLLTSALPIFHLPSLHSNTNPYSELSGILEYF